MHIAPPFLLENHAFLRFAKMAILSSRFFAVRRILSHVIWFIDSPAFYFNAPFEEPELR